MSDPSANSYHRRLVNRRRLLASAAGLTLVSIVAACGSPAAPTNQPAASASDATSSPAASPDDPLAAARPFPYDPGDRDSVISRYARDRARVDSVLAAGVPVLWVTDAIW